MQGYEMLVTHREASRIKSKLLGCFSGGYRSYSEIATAFREVLGLRSINLEPYLRRQFYLPGDSKSLGFTRIDNQRDRYWVRVL